MLPPDPALALLQTGKIAVGGGVEAGVLLAAGENERLRAAVASAGPAKSNACVLSSAVLGMAAGTMLVVMPP